MLPQQSEAPPRRRVFFIILAVVIAAVLVGGTWLAASVFQSPEQRAADAEAPAPGAVYGTVTRGTLTQSQTYTGTIASERESGYVLPAGEGATRSVVTGRAPSVGSTVAAGAVVTEVNGRPVFAVSSEFDLYRDVGFGDEGPDVRAVQDTLVAAGFLGYADGEFGAQTASAVRGWYEAAGYSVPTRVRVAEAPAAATEEGNGSPGDDGGAEKEPEAPAKPIQDAYVPVSEVLAVPSLPAQVLVAPGVGAHAGVEGTDDLVLGAAEVVVRAEAPGAVATGTAEGDAATVLLEGEEFPGTVARIEQAEETSDGEQAPDIMVVTFDAPDDVPAEARGTSVTVQVVTEMVAEDTLIVPSAGVVGRGGDDAIVVKKQPDGSLVEVPVTVAGTLRGMTGVTPIDTEQLAEGDEIRVG